MNNSIDPTWRVSIVVRGKRGSHNSAPSSAHHEPTRSGVASWIPHAEKRISDEIRIQLILTEVTKTRFMVYRYLTNARNYRVYNIDIIKFK